MDKSEGYFIIWRCLFKDTLWLNGTPTQKLLMVVCIGKANHDPGEWHWLGEKFTVERGQFITSLESLKKNMGKHITTQNLRSALANLEKYHFLTQIATKAGRLITVLNYNEGQTVTNKDTNKEVTKTQQRTNKEVTPNKNDNKDNKDKKEYVRHGEFVKLTEDEYKKLIEQFGEAETKEKIIDLNLGIGSKGYKVKDYYMTILSWDRLEKKRLLASSGIKEKSGKERIYEKYKRF